MLFSYETDNSIEIEILKRLNLRQFNQKFRLPSKYQIKLYPANTNKIKKALEEIELVDKKLKSTITKHIDALVI